MSERLPPAINGQHSLNAILEMALQQVVQILGRALR